MSYSGSGDDPFCDLCNGMYIAGTYAPWPAQRLQGAESDGRVSDRDEFLICPECSRKAILAYVKGEARRLAVRSAAIGSVTASARRLSLNREVTTSSCPAPSASRLTCTT